MSCVSFEKTIRPRSEATSIGRPTGVGGPTGDAIEEALSDELPETVLDAGVALGADVQAVRVTMTKSHRCRIPPRG
jgi:hypothetical protein